MIVFRLKIVIQDPRTKKINKNLEINTKVF